MEEERTGETGAGKIQKRCERKSHGDSPSSSPRPSTPRRKTRKEGQSYTRQKWVARRKNGSFAGSARALMQGTPRATLRRISGEKIVLLNQLPLGMQIAECGGTPLPVGWRRRGIRCLACGACAGDKGHFCRKGGRCAHVWCLSKLGGDPAPDALRPRTRQSPRRPRRTRPSFEASRIVNTGPRKLHVIWHCTELYIKPCILGTPRREVTARMGRGATAAMGRGDLAGMG